MINLETVTQTTYCKKHSDVTQLVNRLNRDQHPSTNTLPCILDIEGNDGRFVFKISTWNSVELRNLRSGLEKLGFWLDRPYDDRSLEFLYRYPQQHGQRVKEGREAAEFGVSAFPDQMFRDRTEKLRLSEFISSQTPGAADTNQQIAGWITRNITAQKAATQPEQEAWLKDTELTLINGLTGAFDNFVLTEVSVINEIDADLYRFTIRHSKGLFDAFFIGVVSE